MNGIFYFSSTGNSLYLSKRIKSKLGGKIIYIPNYQGDASEFEKIIVVSPIYSFGLPVHTYNFLLNVNSNSKIYVVLNYGGMAGGADVFTYNYAKENNKNILGVFKMLMPENYTLTFSTPSIYNKMILKKSLKKIDDIILKIKQNGVFIPKKAKTNEKIYFTNKSNWHLIANDFSVKKIVLSVESALKIVLQITFLLKMKKLHSKIIALLALVAIIDVLKKLLYISIKIRKADILIRLSMKMK